MEDHGSPKKETSGAWKNLKRDVLDLFRFFILIIFLVTAWGYFHFIRNEVDAWGLALISSACIVSLALTLLRK